MFGYFLGQARRREVHRRHVEGIAVDQPCRIGLHDPDNGGEGIGHVHHVEAGVGFEPTRITLVAQRLMEYLDRVIGGAAGSGQRQGNEAGQPEATGVETEAPGVVVAQQFGRHLGDAVQRGRALRRVLGRADAGRGWAEGTDGAGQEDGRAVLARHFEHGLEASDIDTPSDIGPGLGSGGKERREVVDGADVMAPDHVLDMFDAGAVQLLEGAIGGARHHAGVRGHHLVRAISLAERRHQLRADPTQGARDQNFPHVPSRSAILSAAQ